MQDFSRKYSFEKRKIFWKTVRFGLADLFLVYIFVWQMEKETISISIY